MFPIPSHFTYIVNKPEQRRVRSGETLIQLSKTATKIDSHTSVTDSATDTETDTKDKNQ